MSVETEPVPPAPEHTPPLQEDAGTPMPGKFFSHAWTRWFTSLRAKINVIDASLVALGDLASGAGVLVKNGSAWALRTLTGTPDRLEVLNGDGAGGDPTFDVVTTNLVAGPGISFGAGTGVDRIIDNGSGPLTLIATGGGGGSGISPISATLFNDFLDGVSSTSSAGNWFTSFSSGTGTFTGGLGRPGVYTLTKTSSVSQANLLSSGETIDLSLGPAEFWTSFYLSDIPPNMSNTNAFQINLGYRTGTTGSANDALVLRCSGNSSNSNVFVLRKTVSGVSTSVDSTITPTAGEWIDAKILTDPVADEATLVINGDIVATITGLPTGLFRLSAQIWTNTGATSSISTDLSIDFIQFSQDLSTSRG